jgi:hypothetical protein
MQFYRSPRQAFNEFHYLELENFLLVSDFRVDATSSFTSNLSMSFSFPGKDGTKLELSRSLSVFPILFNTKPYSKFYKYGLNTKVFMVFGHFSPIVFNLVFNRFVYFKLGLKTRLMETYYVDDSTVGITLNEPLTFFPIRNYSFDYHDWKSPFLFSFSSGPGCQFNLFQRYFLYFFSNNIKFLKISYN